MKRAIFFVCFFLSGFMTAVLAEGEQSCNLASQHCVPCEGGVPPISDDQVDQRLCQVKGWNKNQYRPNSITRSFVFKTFSASIAFVNDVAVLAESEGHHPDIFIFNDHVQLHLYTHAVDGLTENDFILASKINQLSLPEDAGREQRKSRVNKQVGYSENEVKHLLARMPEWTVVTDMWQRLTRELEFKDFVQAIDFMNWLAQESIAKQHYPELYIFYNRMKVSLSNKHARGFTLDDFDMACMIDQKFAEVME